MPEQSAGIPLADVLRAANDLVSAGLIQDYALGGALATIYYTEPFTTYVPDIVFVASDKTLAQESLRFTRICNRKAGASNVSICLSKIFPFNFWPRLV